jgi:hypothetical protein
MGTTELNDPIDVLAKFRHGTVEPTLLRWQGRRYWVQRLNLHHAEKRGTDNVHYFSVTTEVGDCTLCYSQNDLTWKLLETSFYG